MASAERLSLVRGYTPEPHFASFPAPAEAIVPACFLKHFPVLTPYMACLVAAETYNMAPCILKWAVRESARWVQRGLFHGFCQCPVGDIGDIGPVGKHIVKKKN